MKRTVFFGLVFAWVGFHAGVWAQTARCKASFTLGEDQLLCFPQTATTVKAESSWEVLSLDWFLPPGASLQDERTAIVNTTGTVALSATAALRSPNRIVNGDFIDGNTGFTSQLVHSPLTLLPPNTYAITTNPAGIHPDFKPCADHTTGTGRMLASNGNIQPSRNAWCQTVEVDPGGEYELSFWAAALTENQLAQLVWRLDGQNVGLPLVPGPETCDWVNRTITWTAGAQTSVQVCIHNLTGSNSGNDFAIDDISMVEYCTVSDTVTIRHQPLRETSLDTLICRGQSVTAGGQVFDTTTFTTLVLQDGVGCDSLVHLDLQVVDPGLSVAVPGILNCADKQRTLQATVAFGGPGQTFQWLDPAGQPIVGANGPSLVVDAPGNYTLIWTLQTTIGGCSALTNVAVFQDTLAPLAVAGPDRSLTCNAPQVDVQALPPASGSGLTYLWTNLDGPDPTPGLNGAATVSAGGRVVLEVTDPVNGCRQRDTLVVIDLRVEPDEIETVTADPFCNPASGRIEVLGVDQGMPPFQFRLVDAQGGVRDGGPGFFGLAPGVYTLIVTEAGGCTASRELVLGTTTVPMVLLPDVISGRVGESVPVVPAFSFPVYAVTAYRWTVAGALLDCPDCPQVVVSGLGSGWLRLCIDLGEDCERCAESQVNFQEGDVLFIPNVFSPNGDGINDRFGPFPAGQVVRSFLSMRVFDRWGGLIFDWHPSGVGEIPRWDGVAGGKMADPGVFLYVLEAELVDGQRRYWKGEFSLIR